MILESLPLAVSARDLFGLFAADAHSFWLDSADATGEYGRYSLMGSEPIAWFRWQGKRGRLTGYGGAREFSGDPFVALGEAYNLLRGVAGRTGLDRPGLDHAGLGYSAEIPFAGGFVGYFAYDLGGESACGEPGDGAPDCLLGFYDSGAVIDHAAGTVHLFALPLWGGGHEPWSAAAAGRARERVAGLARRLKGVRVRRGRPVEPGESAEPGGSGDVGRAAVVGRRAAAIGAPAAAEWNFTESEYRAMVEKAQAYIRAGEIYQVNLSQRLRARTEARPLDVYLRLRDFNPEPFCAYLDFGEVSVACASPELFLRLRDGEVITRPIKGTRPRSADAGADLLLKEELRRDPKEKAELLMIVDLERNDLGRVCRPGTIEVVDLYRVESHPRVHHLVSTIRGRLRPGVGPVELLRAAFPGGSITGAPKLRAMEIIAELERGRRGLYTGALGYVSLTGGMELNIVIRTLVFRDGWAYLGVGGGITADSEPGAEYRETLHKAEGLLQAIGLK